MLARLKTNSTADRYSAFLGLPWWWWWLVSVYWKKPLTERDSRVTEYGEIIDQFGRVEFLSPSHGC